MNDAFLIKFALCTLTAIAYVAQHISQILYRKIDKNLGGDKNALYVFGIGVMQGISIAIVIEMMNYAFKK